MRLIKVISIIHIAEFSEAVIFFSTYFLVRINDTDLFFDICIVYKI